MEKYTFPLTDVDGRKYRQIDFAKGKFRMYEDTPYIWKQYKETPEEPDWYEGSGMWFQKTDH
jgi:hypothetical protein